MGSKVYPQSTKKFQLLQLRNLCILREHVFVMPVENGRGEIYLFILYFTVKTNVYQNLIKLVFSLI